MTKKNINSNALPEAIGAYSHATEAGGLIFLSGQLPYCMQKKELELSDTKEATRIIMDNICAFLRSEGLTVDNILKTSIFITDMQEFPVINEVYSGYFDKIFPARECVQVAALPKGVGVEISAVIAR